MSIKKYSSGLWVTVPYRKYETATDTITSLPKTIIGDGQNISAYTIKGNMTQASQPTPQNPVYPQETGDKTANLYNYQGVAIGKYIDANGVEQTSGSTGHQILNHSDYVPVTAGTTYVFKIQKEVGYSTLSNAFCWFDSSKQLLYRDVRGEIASSEPYIEMTYTAPTNAAYLVINFRDTYYNTGMLNSGSTVLPYEPFGYKIPISCNGVSYPIYLSEPLRKIGNYTDTINSDGTVTRNIGTVDLGTLTYTTTSSGNFLSTTNISNMRLITNGEMNNAICTEFIEVTPQNVASTPYAFSSCVNMNRTPFLNKTGFENYTVEQFKEAMQGVYMYYVLETPTTETFTAPSIPTSGTAQSFDVDTTLKPSEVSLTYHGWHEHEDTKYTTP